jgi:uncharacterized protein involved in exopolysaccharide biosynthesis
LAEPKLEELTRSYSLAQAADQFWSTKADEAGLYLASGTSELRIAGPAVVPDKPLPSGAFVKTVAAALAGLIGMSMLAFSLEYMRKARGREVQHQRTE